MHRTFGSFGKVYVRLWKQGADLDVKIIARTILDCWDLWNSRIWEPCWERKVWQHSFKHGWFFWRFQTKMQRILHDLDKKLVQLFLIPYRIVIRPVQQSVIVRIMVSYGIETEIPSPNRSGQNSWIMLCRGTNRCMDEVLVPKWEYNNASRVCWSLWKQLKRQNLLLRYRTISHRGSSCRKEQLSGRNSVLRWKHNSHQRKKVGNCSWVWKNTICDWGQYFAISVTFLDDVRHMWHCHPFFFMYQTWHIVQTFLSYFFNDFGSSQASLCIVTDFLQCALSDDWTSLRLSLCSFIILTGLVSIDLGKENHTCCGFLSCV